MNNTVIDNLTVSRERLHAIADKTMLDASELRRFKRDLDSAEKNWLSNNVNAERVQKAIESLAILIEANDQQSLLSQCERISLAQEVTHHMAYPRGIDQGGHSNCGAVALQVIIAALYPDRFADLVRQVATTGKYITSADIVVTIDESSLKPDWESACYRPYDATRNFGRSLASQIFHIAGVNAAFAAQNQPFRYKQESPKNPKDAGERLFDLNTGEVLRDFQMLRRDELAEIGRQIAGCEIPLLKRGCEFNTAADLKRVILELKNENKLPAILFLSSRSESLLSVCEEADDDQARWPLVTIWDLDKTGKFLVDSQSGRRNEYEALRRLPVVEVFNATN